MTRPVEEIPLSGRGILAEAPEPKRTDPEKPEPPDPAEPGKEAPPYPADPDQAEEPDE